MERIVLAGGGGHAKVVIDAIKKGRRFSIAGIVDPMIKPGTVISGIKVLGNDDELVFIRRKKIKAAFITVGSIGNTAIREELDARLKELDFSLPSIIHPSAVIAEDVTLKDGAFVAAGAIIGPGTVIGRHAIINTMASIDHDSDIGDFVHVAPGATVCGLVKIGRKAHIGTGAIIVQCTSIKSKAFVKAGTIVHGGKNAKKKMCIHNS